MPVTMPFPLLLALRYLRSTRRDAATSFLSAVAVAGIALGVAALVLALAALDGLQQALRGEILSRTAQIEIELPPGVDGAEGLALVRRQSGVVEAQELLRGRGWVAANGAVREVEIVGYSARLPRSFPGADAGLAGVVVGSGLAARLGLRPGERLDLVSARPTLSPLGPIPRQLSLAIAGVFRSGRTERVDRIAVPIAEAARLLPGAVPRIEVVASDLDAALDLADTLRAALPPGARVLTWQDLNRPLFFALRLERAVMFAGVFLIVVVAALALVADLALVQSAKWREVGALAAMGATGRDLGRAFTLLGGMLAGLGSVAGGGVGAGVAWLLDRHHLVRLPGEVYFIDYLPFAASPIEVLAVVGLALSLAVAFSAYAARRVALARPAEAIRR